MENPGSKDEVGQAQSVVGVEMRDEDALKVRHFESWNVKAGCSGSSTADNAGTAIEEVGFVVIDDSNGGARALGVGARSSGAENDNVCGGA